MIPAPFEDGKTMFVICFLSVIFPFVLALEESVSINRPRARAEQPWVQINTGNYYL